MKYTITIALLICCIQVFAQDSASSQSIQLPDKFISSVDKKIAGLDDQLSKQTNKYLNILSRQEEKIFAQLSKLDTSSAGALLGNAKEKYTHLAQKLNDANGRMDKLLNGRYLSGIDSLGSALGFLKGANNVVSKSKDIQQQLSNSLQNLGQLQSKLNEAANIQQYLQQRQLQLKELLSTYTNLPKNISKSFGKYQSQLYYYTETIKDCKKLLNDPDKLVSKVLATLQHIPSFSKFFSRYSMLAAMFPTPDNYGTPQALAGLQTRADVQQLMQQQLPISTTGGNPAQYLQQQMQQAQQQLSQLKDKLNQLGINSGGGDMSIPESKINPEKTKSVWKRIQVGTNYSTQRSSNYFPTRLEMSVTAAYKLSEKTQVNCGNYSKF